MNQTYQNQSGANGNAPGGGAVGASAAAAAPGTATGAGGAAGPNGGQPWGGPFPSLHLWPLQDTFAMKMIHLPEGQRIKIGRQTNNKTVPGERNAYFDSKVLSRLHAEIWEQGGKIYIKDVRSSNGTFINGDRLSPESVESEPFELKSEDQVEFGIDIVSEDNRTIVHHKVAAKVYCVFGPDDAAFSARELVNYQNQDVRGARRLGAGPANGHQNNQLAQMGAPITSSGGKASGLSFDHVLNKLQSELARSKETGAELQNLATAFTDIQETLGGGLPPSQNGSAAQFIPPQYRSATTEAQAALAGPHGQQAAAFIALQNQLTETQSSVSDQLDKIRELEGQLKEHETIGREVSAIREQMEESKREMDLLLAGHRGRRLGRRATGDDDDDDDDDDARSVMTLMDSDDAAQRVRDRRRNERERDRDGERERRQPDRPRTPEPHMNGDSDDDTSPTKPDGTSSTTHEIAAQNVELQTRIQTLSAEISEAMQLSRSLQAEHSEAMSAVKLLTDKVGALESGITSRVMEEMTKAEERWNTWRSKFEDGWKRERESWDTERERLRGVVREWEEASRRAHEEEEERELNERLSADSDGDGEGDDGSDGSGSEDGEEEEGISIDGWEETVPGSSPNKRGVAVDVGVGVPGSGSGSLRKKKRRQSSTRGLLAVRGLKALAGDVVGPGGGAGAGGGGEAGPGAGQGEGSSTPKMSSANVIDGPPGTGTGGGGGAQANSRSGSGPQTQNRLRRRKGKRSTGGTGGTGGGGGGKGAAELSRSGSSRTIKGSASSSPSANESRATLQNGGKAKGSPLAITSARADDRDRSRSSGSGSGSGSSESGKESGDTLKEEHEESEGGSTTTSTRVGGRGGGGKARARGGRSNVDQRGIQPLPIFTVLVVAVVAGALYYKHKE